MNGAEVLTKFTADTTQVDKATEKVSNDFDTLAETGVNMFKALTLAADAFAVSILATGVSYNAEIETYLVRLSSLLDSEEEAAKVFNQIKEDAKKTPFDASNLLNAESLLLAAGVSAEEARQSILALGDVVSLSGGGNEELQRMAINLQQIKNQGGATAMDLKQFKAAYIDLNGILADYLGISKEEVAQMKSSEITYEMITGAMIKASSEGGKYNKAMEKQSKTLKGSITNLKASYQELTGELSIGVFNAIKDLIPKLTEMFNWLSENKDIVLAVASAILIWLNAITAMLIITKITGLITAFSAVVGISAGAIGLWVIAIGAVVAAFILLYNKCEWFRVAVDAIWEFIKNVFQGAYQFIYSNVIEPFIARIMFLVDKMIWLKDQFINVKNGIQTAWNGIGTFFSNIFSAIKNSFKSCINWIIDKFNWFIRQVNKIKFPDWEWLGDLAGKGFNFKELSKLATGTNYVPQDMIAEIHEGEAVVPKKFNPYANGVNASMLGTMDKNTNVIVNIENNMEFDALGQLVNNVKTFSGGAKNDYNYGMGG